MSDTGTGTGTGQPAGCDSARCDPEELEVAAIGDELAAGRPVRDHAGRLSRAADRDLVALGEAPRLPRTGYGRP
ncbi:dsRBD fold-containing protein [Streptomyces sp. NPDC051109]|uniref:dsRBD fold-containing protein n=1 Tax=Streptomyces sp. NPDC051109 TaxID=3365642 RepID=UPI00379079FA